MLSAFGKRCKSLQVNVFLLYAFTCKRQRLKRLPKALCIGTRPTLIIPRRRRITKVYICEGLRRFGVFLLVVLMLL